jgi:membrane fusion protein (multidrug efflux system)
VKVTVELDGGETGPLVPGSFVRVLVETDRHEDTITIPQRAVVEQGGESFAFRVDEERNAHRVRIETGYSFDDQVEVLSGLAEGDRIVTAGHGALKNDAEVRIIGEPDPRAKDAASKEPKNGDGTEELVQSGQGN